MSQPAAPLSYQCRILERQSLAPQVYRLRLSRPDASVEGLANWHFAAGQYVFVGQDDLTRPYSIASAPQRDYIELHIRDTGHGLSRRLCDAATTDVAVSAAQGFGLPDHARQRPLLLLAGGVGIAPVASILDGDAELAARAHLYWGAAREQDLYLDAHWREMAGAHGLAYHPVLEEDAPGRRRGHIGPAIAEDLPDLSGRSIYLAGPAAMLAATLPQLVSLGAEKAYIFGDGITV